jgi:N,N'-diacetyllegionaminate synthase
VIAEIGINHGGDETACARLIEAAARSGADAVKLQTVTPEDSYHPDTESYAIFSKAVLPRGAYERLARVAADCGVLLFSTPGDRRALDMLLEAGAPAIKISSGLLTNLPLIRQAAASGRPMILSTGMSHLDEVEEAVAVARAAGCRHFAVLQCTSLYPAPAETLNLRAMAVLRDVLGAPIGYSDHYQGPLASIAAVAAGAELIEKHFTLDASARGADHAISIEPDVFAAMIRDIRAIERMLGSETKAPVPEEVALRDQRHRYVVAARDLPSQLLVTESDVLLMRLPAGRRGLRAKDVETVLGRRLARPIARFEPIEPAMLGEKP